MSRTMAVNVYSTRRLIVREWSSPGSTESWPGHCVVSLVTVYLYSTFTGVSRHGYLNLYIKFKLIELAITLYQEFGMK